MAWPRRQPGALEVVFEQLPEHPAGLSGSTDQLGEARLAAMSCGGEVASSTFVGTELSAQAGQQHTMTRRATGEHK